MISAGIVILAAGNSSRLGHPKQLLPYKDQTLLSHTIGQALQTDLEPIILVTGAFATEIQAGLDPSSLTTLHNPEWQQGMGAGIALAVKHILGLCQLPQALIIAVCDQPHLSSDLLQDLLATHLRSGKGIVAAAYGDTKGTPVLFHQKYFHELSGLSGTQGAKQLLRIHEDDLTQIDFPEGNIDIDTEEDYLNLLHNRQ